MGDQLISCDQLLVNILLFSEDENAARRINPLTIRRCLTPHRLMMEADGWEKHVYIRLVRLARAHISDEVAAGVVNGSPFRFDPPNDLRGNYSVWVLLEKLWKGVESGRFINKGAYNRHVTRLTASIDSAAYRTGVNYSYQEKSRFADPILSAHEVIAQLSVLEETLWEIHSFRAKELNTMVLAAKDDESPKHGVYVHKQLPSEIDIGLDVTVMGPLVYVSYSHFTTCFTKTHFERLCKMLRTLISLGISYPALDMRVSYPEFVYLLLASVMHIVEEDVDFLGECLKGAKAIIVASLDDSSIPGKTLVEGYCESMKPDRRRKARYLSSFVKSVSRTLETAVNITNIFKAFPHPDANMHALFESIKGVRDPHTVEPKRLDRFMGTLRRAVFSSLSLQDYDVRILGATADGPGQVIQTATHETRKKTSALRTYSTSTWADTRFTPILNFIDFYGIEVKASSKSSQKEFDFESDDLLQAIEYMAGQDVPEPSLLKEAGTINDSVSDLTGLSELHPERAIKRFLKVVELHEEFEAKFMESHPGCTIDEIPPDVLGEFIESNPKARYVVGTEPKFGEIHKKVTRMFYMAQQYLKVITQMLERYTKQICRRQPGVSITKSYSSRRRDLENFCHSMTGPHGDKKAVFVSFDMSEFSKKFPMELVRKFGDILYELSGQEWMRRIDLVFRASVVIHNSRGFFSKVSGVRGGFEGFFNFIWSSIHVTIMEMALEGIGLQGETLVYSDDGILMFYCPRDWSNKRIYERVMKIQKVYAEMGLNFHLGKSMVSYNVWEYLGDICYENKLLPMWLKEVSSITRNVKNRGLEPFYSKIKALQGQCDAAVMAGAPVLHTYVLKRYFYGALLDRLGLCLSPQMEELLAIVPSSAGGLRITSPFETSFVGTIEKDAEVIADFALLRRIDPSLSDLIIAGVSDFLKAGSDAAQAVISGTRLITTHSDVSGMRAINDCIDLIKYSGQTAKSFPNNPMGTSFKKDLVKLLETLKDINLDVITDFIYSTPAWTEYSNAMSVIRSSGVLRLVPRKALARIQAEDTRRVKTAILSWVDYVANMRGAVPKGNVLKLIEKAEYRIMRGLKLAKMRPSPRMVLSRDSGTDGIHVYVDLSGDEYYSSLKYMEPKIRMSKDETTLAWASEGMASSQTRSMRKFMNSVARTLAFSPESESAITNIAKLIGVEIPPITPGLYRGAQRLGGAHGKDVDAKIFLPRWFSAGSKARYYGELSEYIYRMERADRTTYLEAARVMACLQHYLTNSIKRTPSQLMIHYRYSFPIEQILPMHATVPMTSAIEFRTVIKQTILSENMIHEYRSAFNEYVKTAEQEDTFVDMAYLRSEASGFDLQMIREVYVSSIKSWLVSTRRNSKMTLLNSLTIPLPRIDTTEILLDAVVQAALTIIDPRSRRSLLDKINRWLAERSRMPEMEAAQLPDYVLESRDFQQFVAEVHEMLAIIDENAPDELPSIDLGMYRATTEPILTRLLKYTTSMNILNRQRIVVIRTGNHPATKVTPAHRTAYREAYTATLSALYNCCRDLRWDKHAIKAKLNIHMDPDELITAVLIGRALLRESSHRTILKPYNSISGNIEMFKFFYLVSEMIRLDQRLEEEDLLMDEAMQDDFIANFRLPDIPRQEIQARFDLQPKDVDHLAMLRAPLLPDLGNRAKEYLRSSRSGVTLGTNKAGYYFMPIDEVQRVQHSFYQLIIVAASEALQEYSSDLEKEVLSTFNPSTPAVVETYSLEAMRESISGDILDPDALPEEEANDLIRLLRLHVNDMCVRSFIKGVRAVRGASGYTHMVASDHYDAGGLTISSQLDPVFRNGGSDLYAYMMEYSDPHYALTDFILIGKGDRSSVTIMQLSGTNRYFLVGVSDRYVEHEPYRFIDQMPVRISEGIDPSQLIPAISLTGQAKHVKAMTELLQVRSTTDEETFRNIKMIATRTRRVDRRPQVVEVEPVLLAAYNIINENPSNTAIFAAYVGVLMWLKAERDPDKVIIYSRAIERTLERASEAERLRILLDVANTAQWLAQSYLTSGFSVVDSEVRDWTRELLRVHLRYRVPPSGVIASLKSFDEVQSSLRDRSKLLGNISQHLYKVEELKLIGYLEHQLSQEEEEMVEKIMEDL